MMDSIVRRMMRGARLPARDWRNGLAFETAAAGIAVSLIAAAIIAASLGGSAAADEASVAKGPAVTPISLAGRWSGQHYASGNGGCADNECVLTYDIVACKDGWCGIAVKDGKTCGRIGVRLTGDTKMDGGDAFKGKLELAEGSAPYAVEAWYRSEKGGRTSLHFLGDTGPQLLLMRRSFPFEADLARTGEATCTLEKATS